MSDHGKTIRIYLADGTPTGIRHAELVNWTGQAIVCPRGRLPELMKWDECQRQGVYLLFGDDPSSAEPLLYVGEAENVWSRLQDHVKKKDFWNRVVLFTSKDENLTKSHVKYLEARIFDIAKSVGRSKLENGTVPQTPSLPRADRAAMEEFLEPLRVLLSALGFNVLQPISPRGKAVADEQGPDADGVLYLSLPKRKVDGKGTPTDEGFVVFAGARASKRVLSGLGEKYRAWRNQLLADGDFVEEQDSLRVAQDVLFSSPSAAAVVLLGSNANGREAWKDAQGVSMKALELKQSELAAQAVRSEEDEPG